MDNEIRQRMLSSPGFRVVRWTAPWIALVVLLVALNSLTGQFRKAAAEREALTTSTVDATSSVGATSTAKAGEPAKPAEPAKTEPPPVAAPTPAPQPQSTLSATTIAVALVEGILLRKDPSPNGEVMDRLRNGTEMMVLERTDTWLKVKDPLGRVGWIRNNENLISLKQKP